MLEKNAPVYIAKCEGYDNCGALETLLDDAVERTCKTEMFQGKNVVIKPNLVRKMDPEKGGTTHPVMLRALISVLKKRGVGKILIAESPGGLYNAAALKQVYEGCGIAKVAADTGAELNFRCEYGDVKAPAGKKSKMFEIIDPVRNAEVLINLCKMKSHGMLTQSCAAKNFFGVIPGVKKFEMHARFPDSTDFAGMLCDLNEVLYERAKILNICDGIVAMEGNGPTNGVPKRAKVVLVSQNSFCLDLAAAKIMNIGTVPELLREGILRGYCPGEYGELNFIKESLEHFVVTDFALPDSSKSGALKKILTLNGGRYARFLEPRPKIDEKKCRGCGECVRSCPAHTISFRRSRKKNVAYIEKENCIRCYCCQELCPFDSVRIRTNPLIRMVNKL